MKRPTIVAEIGCNHQGDLEIAKEMVRTAATFCGVDYVKFQKRCVKELLTPEEYDAPHPAPLHSYGRTYGEHRELLEFTIDQHRELFDWCRRHDVGYSTSVWDPTSAREAVELSPHHVKVPSACNLDFRIFEHLATAFAGEIHISLGMTTPEEGEAIVRFMEGQGAAHRVVLYACTSGYPVPFEQVCLLEIARLRTEYGDRVKAIGFSGTTWASRSTWPRSPWGPAGSSATSRSIAPGRAPTTRRRWSRTVCAGSSATWARSARP